MKKRICKKVKLKKKNESTSSITCRFSITGKYIALQICDDVKTMIESFPQQQEIFVVELYNEVDVTGGSVFNVTNYLLSRGNNLSHNDRKTCLIHMLRTF